MGILSYIGEQKRKFKANQEAVSEARAVNAGKEAIKAKERRLILEKRDKQYKQLEREHAKLNKLEEREASRRKAASVAGKVAGFLQGARKEVSALRSEGANPWRDNNDNGSDNIRAAFGMANTPAPKAKKKNKRREVPQEAFNPWR